MLGEADQAEEIGNILLVQAYTNVTDGMLPPLLCVEYWGYWRPEQLHYQSFMSGQTDKHRRVIDKLKKKVEELFGKIKVLTIKSDAI